MVDHAFLFEDELSDLDAASLALREALQTNPSSCTAALMLERLSRRAGDADATAYALKTQATQTEHPILKGTLLIEHARVCENQGNVDDATDSLRSAVEIEASRPHALGVLSRFARRHERWDILCDSLVQQAEIKPAEGAAHLHEAAWVWMHD